ncbi:MAG TPA: hypothetical protein VFG04_08340 [Planctomycetaceae bacterium]|jgi:hypothetical protein|nr:hypothetical protein [Planctomycetaceae bacterium]
MTLQSNAYPLRSPRLTASAAILAVASLTLAVLAGLSSLVGENYRIDPPFLDPFRAPTRDEAMLIYPAEYALKSTEYNDVVFLGDSTCRCSIDPLVFQRVSGLSAYNLGSMGALGVGGYRLILQLYLQHHPKPRAVVLAVTPDDLDANVSELRGGWPDRFRWSYSFDDGNTIHMPEDLESVMFLAQRGMQIARLYRAHSFAGQRFDPRVQFLYGGGKDTYLTLEQKMRQTKGYWALAGKHWDAGTDAPNKTKVTASRQWEAGLPDLAQLTEANGVLLIVRLVPLVETSKTDYDPIRGWLRGLEREYARLSVIRPEVLLYDEGLCWDYQHLNAAGVDKFSRSLAEDVAARLSHPQEGSTAKDQSARNDRVKAK